MLIERIKLEEFRGILRCEKPLDLSEFTVLIGRNNSGKSSILEALSLFPRPDYILSYLGLKKSDFVANLHSGASSLVYGYSGSASIEYKVDGKLWSLRLNEFGSVDEYSISGFDEKRLIGDPFRATEVALEQRVKPVPNVSPGEKISKLVFFLPSDTEFMNKLAALTIDPRNQNMIIKSGAHVRVAKELINKCVDDKYTEILLGSPQLRVRKERADGQPLYINIKDLGDGAKKVAITTLWLDATNPSLILWDDFEGSAHPSLIKELLKWLSKKKWQVVLSTHSIDVLNALVEVGPKDANVIQLRKSNEDVLCHESLSVEELEDVLDSSQDPRIMIDSLKL